LEGEFYCCCFLTGLMFLGWVEEGGMGFCFLRVVFCGMVI
jgi:hypothetical protein